MQFTPLGLGDYSRLSGFFTEQKYRLSAYSLPSLIVWSNHIYEAEYALAESALDGEALIVANQCRLRPGDSYLLLPISPRRNYAPAELSDLAQQANLKDFWYVPEDYLERYGRDAVESFFLIAEQPELDEYLYRTEDLAILKGNRYASKRNWINRFSKEYDGRVRVETIKPSAIEECLAFLEEWCRAFQCAPDQNESLYCEKQAAIQALNGIEPLGLQGILVRIDDAVEAFAIASGLTQDIGVLSFEKARSEIKGLYQFLDNACAKQLFSSYRFINKENDMGLPGLAQSKRSYHPIEKIKSYKLTLK
jgi:uncharacterized protein